MCGMRQKATVERRGRCRASRMPRVVHSQRWRSDRQHTITSSNLMRARCKLAMRRRGRGQCRASSSGSGAMNDRRKLAIAEEKTGAIPSELRWWRF